MGKSRGTSDAAPAAVVVEAWRDVGASFERFCLTAGVTALDQMMAQDAVELCGPRYGHKDGKNGRRWGKTQGKIEFHGGKVAMERMRGAVTTLRSAAYFGPDVVHGGGRCNGGPAVGRKGRSYE